MQQNLFRFTKTKLTRVKNEFGDSLSLNKRKTARPQATGQALHIVLRRSDVTKIDFREHRQEIEANLKRFELRSNLKLYKFAIVSNHLHILLMAGDRERYNYFVRSVSGRLAQKLKIKWQLRPYTRVVTWGRDFKSTQNYIEQNHLEAIGAIPYQPRKY
jgi:REP element-mobilizing transposase RayT